MSSTSADPAASIAATSSADRNAKITWEIDNFFAISSQLSSEFFAFPSNDNFKFQLTWYTTTGYISDNICIDLCLVSYDDDVECFDKTEIFPVCYQISILNSDQTICLTREIQTAFRINEFMHKSCLVGDGVQFEISCYDLFGPNNGLFADDKLTIYCEIDYSCLKKLNLVTQDYRFLLESGDFSDAVLVVGDKKFLVHKNILTARSDVFAAMFEHDCVEKRENRVNITDISVEACELMLRYIYTGHTPKISAHLSELLVAADKYQLEYLKSHIESNLMDNLTVENVAALLVLADLHQADSLKDKCVSFITENGKEVIDSANGWAMLSTKAHLMADLFAKVFHKYTPSELKAELVEPFEADFATLLESAKHSDALLIVGGEELSVHKNILSARSSVFATLLSTQNRLLVDDISVCTCKQMLLHIYTGQIPVDMFDYASELLQASHKYQLNRLKVACEEVLYTSIDVASVVNLYLLAETNQASNLKQNCFEFIAANVKIIISTEGWDTFARANPELTIQLLQSVLMKVVL